MPETCAQGHPIRSSADRYADGWCKQCRKAKNQQYREKQRAALALVKALAANGVHVDPETLTLTTEPTTEPNGVVAQRLVNTHGDIE
ncbi:hypothetical protein [Rhodococcus opacus]|uniref:hypothetical protein n=1 Tax=Rhodococcus opacus TaxID=37919 RepID=UPI002235AEF2|nr:hypothetical protein [Rhodococcus opacus]UZG58237.1 hypothetical protein ONE62_13360 [Rhodococcus opacus]